MIASKYMETLAATATKIDYEGIMNLIDDVLIVKRSGGRVFICGNGGSAATADHFTLDLQKSLHIPCISLSSLAAITAYANDNGYRNIYRDQLERLAQPRDLLIAISTSGKSPNILEAAGYCRAHLMTVTTLTAGDGGALATMGHNNIIVPTDNIGIAEDLHTAVLHSVIDYLRNGGE